MIRGATGNQAHFSLLAEYIGIGSSFPIGNGLYKLLFFALIVKFENKVGVDFRKFLIREADSDGK